MISQKGGGSFNPLSFLKRFLTKGGTQPYIPTQGQDCVSGTNSLRDLAITTTGLRDEAVLLASLVDIAILETVTC